jgi:hypothetical protein
MQTKPFEPWSAQSAQTESPPGQVSTKLHG